MDLAKARKVLGKLFKEYSVSGSIDEETLLMFCCVDLVREDMVQSTPVAAAAPARVVKKKEPTPIQQMTLDEPKKI